jgi:hypothetical protein
MIHELKFSSETMFSDSNGKNSMFFGNGCLKWPKMYEKTLKMAEKFVPWSRVPEC